MYASKVSFVLMLILYNSFESSEFPDSGWILRFMKRHYLNMVYAQLVLTLTQRCVYFRGRVKDIGVSM